MFVKQLSRYILCTYLLNYFLFCEGVSTVPKTHGNWGKEANLLLYCVLQEVWHITIPTRWTQTVVCVMTLLTDKAAQVRNPGERV